MPLALHFHDHPNEYAQMSVQFSSGVWKKCKQFGTATVQLTPL